MSYRPFPCDRWGQTLSVTLDRTRTLQQALSYRQRLEHGLPHRRETRIWKMKSEETMQFHSLTLQDRNYQLLLPTRRLCLTPINPSDLPRLNRSLLVRRAPKGIRGNRANLRVYTNIIYARFRWKDDRLPVPSRLLRRKKTPTMALNRKRRHR